MADTLRFVTCGSVDDGKSTLIGRLLFHIGAAPDDQLAALAGSDGRPDYSRLFDGLQAEREQGITIDVAYRYFTHGGRRYVVADAPGHEQYTRNMATAASTADLAVVLVDASKGVSTQTRRHAQIVRLMGVRAVILAVSKMDLIDWDEAVFRGIVATFEGFADRIGLEKTTAIPLSGREGDNVAARSEAAPWFDGPTLLDALAATAPRAAEDGPMRMPVQGVLRPDATFRGFTGRIAQGTARPGDRIVVLPGGQSSRIARVVTASGDLDAAPAGRSTTLTLEDQIDCSRGDMIVAADLPPEVADQFEAMVVWMAEEPLLPGRSYLLKAGTRTVTAQVTDLKHRLNVDTLEALAADTLPLNGIGACNLSLAEPVAFEPYEKSRALGGFILIDKATQATVGAGMLRLALRRSHTIAWQALDVDKSSRARLKGQKPRVIWFTGLSGAGKSTIANLLDKRLNAEGRHTYLIDGDNVRHGLNRDLGFTAADRVENVRRVAEVARLMADAGLIVLVSLISPFRAERAMAREMMGEGEFVEVFVDTPLRVAEGRDVKGLYAKARAGKLANFTGIDSPYEPPETPEIRIDTTALSAEAAADMIAATLSRLDHR